MGVDIHGYNFLRFNAVQRGFGKTLTVGRQENHLPPGMIPDSLMSRYAEPIFLEQFGASEVDSVDASDYEDASFVYDLNHRLPPKFEGKYDTVIDLGTSEHVFNVAMALENISMCTNVGGRIFHVLPAINFCGHGFWQFSPEIFLVCIL